MTVGAAEAALPARRLLEQAADWWDLVRCAPLVVVRNRPMVLSAAPHLAWPQARAWRLAWEVDGEIELAVGCSRSRG